MLKIISKRKLTLAVAALKPSANKEPARRAVSGPQIKKLIHKVVLSATVALALFLGLSSEARAQVTRPVHKTARSSVFSVSGEIRWPRSYGIIPMGPGNAEAAPMPCGQMWVAATVHATGKAVAVSNEMTFDRYYKGDYYVCKYSFKVPPDTPLYMIAGMGGTLLLPKMSDMPMYWTDAWIGGTYNKPPAGSSRTFTGSQTISVNASKPTAVVNFEMTYARPDNPR